MDSAFSPGLSEQALCRLVRASATGMYLAEPSAARVPRVVSPGLALMLGYASHEELPRGDLWRLHLHPDDRDYVASERARRSGAPVTQLQYRLVDRQGGVHWMLEESTFLEQSEDFRATVHAVLVDVTEATETQRSLEVHAHNLRERVKELDCLYAITHMSEEGPVEQLLQRVVELLPRAWQYPEIAIGRIFYGDVCYSTGEAPHGGPVQAAEMVIRGEVVGRVEVGYRKNTPDAEPPAFLPEEWSLLRSIARRLGGAIERRQTDEALRRSEGLYRVLAKNIPGVLVGLFDANLRCTLAEGSLKGVLCKTRVEGQSLDEVWRKEVRFLVAMCREATQGVDQTGEYRWQDMALSVRTVPIADANGTITGMFVVQDVTQRRALEKELLDVSAREQRRMGQDLHDGLGQILTGLACLGRTLSKNLEAEASRFTPQAEELTQYARQAMTELRAIARGLNPVDVSARGLSVALRELAYDCENLFHVACEFECSDDIEVAEPSAATQLYRIAQEAISNAARHGRAGAIRIVLEREPGGNRLIVADNGCGFSPTERAAAGMGLRIMRYRAEMLGGVLDIQSAPGQGTRITCLFPLEREDSSPRSSIH